MEKAEREAYADLDAAIEKLMRIKGYNVHRRYDGSEVPMMNVTWMVLVEQRGFDGEDNFIDTGLLELAKQ